MGGHYGGFKMNFNFNLGAVKVTYEKSNGDVVETVCHTRAQWDWIELHHTLIEANQT